MGTRDDTQSSPAPVSRPRDQPIQPLPTLHLHHWAPFPLLGSIFCYILEDPEGSHAQGYDMEKQTLALLHIPQVISVGLY